MTDDRPPRKRASGAAPPPFVRDAQQPSGGEGEGLRARKSPARAAGRSAFARQRTGSGEEATAAALRIVERPAFHILVVLAATGGGLSRPERTALALACELAEPDGAVVAAAIGLTASVLSAAGADRFVARRAGLGPERTCAEIAGLWSALRPRHIILADDMDGRDLARRLSVRLNLSLCPGVQRIEGRRFVRPSGRAGLDLVHLNPAIVTVGETAAEPDSVRPGEARELHIHSPVPEPPERVKVLATETPPANEVPLEQARLVIGAGAGVTDWEAFAAAARALRAAPACTRVVSDRRMMPRERQIGASGRAIAADCYIAVGVSGASQHLEGIERCRLVVAVNHDAYAPIVRRADLTLVTDADGLLTALAGISGASA